MVSFTPGQMQILINEIDGERLRAAGTEKGLLESGREMDDQRQRTWGRSEVTVTLRSDLQLAPSTADAARAPTAAPALSLPDGGQPLPALSRGPTPRCATAVHLHTRLVRARAFSQVAIPKRSPAEQGASLPKSYLVSFCSLPLPCPSRLPGSHQRPFPEARPPRSHPPQNPAPGAT